MSILDQLNDYLNEVAIEINAHSADLEPYLKKEYMVAQTQSFYDSVLKQNDFPWYLNFSIRGLLIPGLADLVVWELKKENILTAEGTVSPKAGNILQNFVKKAEDLISGFVKSKTTNPPVKTIGTVSTTPAISINTNIGGLGTPTSIAPNTTPSTGTGI